MLHPQFQTHNTFAALNPRSLFARTVRLLHESGCIDLKKEFVHDIGLIVGGSHPQPPHFDAAKVKKINEEDYEQVMSLPNAPAVALVACKGVTRIGVETNMLSHVTAGRDGVLKKAYIVEKGKKKGAEVQVAGEIEMTRYKEDGTSSVESMYIMQSKKGFIFRGDFDHSGMPPLMLDGEGQKAWNRVNEILMPLVVSGSKLAVLLEEVFEKLCEVPSMDSITRLHCMVMPRDKDFTIAPEFVGHNLSFD
jgi:hypothetical protein